MIPIKGYELIPLYRKRKKLPTKKQERQNIINKLVANADNLEW